MNWHLLTGEYPPQRGGVSDYTRLVATGLAASGDDVTVWAPPVADPEATDPGVVVRRLPDRFGIASLRRLSRELDRLSSPQRLLVQYVPHAFGWKGANVPFCAWIASRRRDAVWVMFHEVGFPFDLQQSPARNALAAANRLMAKMIGGAAARLFVSIPGWTSMVQSLVGADRAVEWLPVPSSLPVAADAPAAAAVRARVGGGRPIVGHFGSHGAAIRPLLADALVPVLRDTDACAIVIGRDGDRIQREVATRDAASADRIHVIGPVADHVASLHIAACDVMLQPYPDGISTRRTSAMAALAHGVPVATTTGWLTEPLWREAGAAWLAPVGDPAALAAGVARLLASSAERAALADRGARLYRDRFRLSHTIDALRNADAPARARGATIA